MPVKRLDLVEKEKLEEDLQKDHNDAVKERESKNKG